MVISGYDTTTAEKQVPAVFNQKGVREELAKLGFDEDNAKAVVGEILNTGEEQNRLKAADMIFKVNATYAPERQEIKNTVVNISFFANPKIIEATKNLDEVVKEYITNENKESLETLQSK